MDNNYTPIPYPTTPPLPEISLELVPRNDRALGFFIGTLLALLSFYPSFWVFDRIIRPRYLPLIPPLNGDLFDRPAQAHIRETRATRRRNARGRGRGRGRR
jgi:hypothetical protein